MIVTADSNALEVNFTIEGSIPSETNGEVYSEPLLIESTTTFRGMASRPGSIPSRVSTHSYLFPGQIKRQGDTVPQGYPETWASSSDFLPADYKMDLEIIDHPEYAHLIEESLFSLPAILLVTEIETLFGQESPDEFESLLLRAEYSESWTNDNHTGDRRSRSQYLRDLSVSDSFAAMGQVSPRGFSAHLFLNGIGVSTPSRNAPMPPSKPHTSVGRKGTGTCSVVENLSTATSGHGMRWWASPTVGLSAMGPTLHSRT